MSAPPPTAGPATEASSGRLGAGEAAVVITVVAAVTPLAVLERPIPLVLAQGPAHGRRGSAARRAPRGPAPGRPRRARRQQRRPRVSRTVPGPAEVEQARLRGWLRAAKGRHLRLPGAAHGARQMPVSACTARRALDGRLPTLYTVRAFARGAGADEEEGARMWAATAVRPGPVRKPAAYVPGRGITTRAGLASAMEKVRAAAGGPSLRQLTGSPAAAGRVSRSALHNTLTGRRLPAEKLLAGLAAACGAGEDGAPTRLGDQGRCTFARYSLPTRPKIISRRSRRPTSSNCAVCRRPRRHRAGVSSVPQETTRAPPARGS
ncbi:hypothetical protein ACJ6WF_47885 [Streptomyces sp. MMS24-I2-30]|uniref:hypothetical protein n=1 Tax=Streptomyces sp. MMS24-I2-30 TaxID=3351564 RepID=UPI00389695B0